MASEYFLKNPVATGFRLPKKTAKKKSKAKYHKPTKALIGREGSLHRPRTYTKHGHWETSDRATVARPGIKVNPMGEELMFIGANPFREVRSMAKHHKKQHHTMHNPFTFHHSGHKKHHHKKYHHNPFNIGVDSSSMKPILATIAGGLSNIIVPNILNNFIAGANAGMMGYLVRAGVAVAGTFGTNKFFGKEAAQGFAGGSLVSIAVKGVSDYMPQLLSGSLTAPTVVAAPAAAPAAATVSGFERLSGFEQRKVKGMGWYQPRKGSAELGEYSSVIGGNKRFSMYANPIS